MRKLILAPALGFGVASTAIFVAPSFKYAEASQIGRWLTSQVGFDSGYLFYASAAPDVMALVVFATLNAVPNLVRNLRQTPGALRKAIKAILIGGFAGVQTLQYPAVTYGTGGSPALVFAAGVGTFPNALFVATNLVSQDIPKVWAKLDEAYLRTIGRIFSYPEYQARRSVYQLHRRLLQRLQAGQIELRREKRTLALQNKSLAQQWHAITTEGWRADSSSILYAGVKIFLQSASMVVGAGVISSASLLNMIKNVMPHFVEEGAASIGLGSLLSLAGTYLFSKLIVGGVGNVIDMLADMLSGRPVNSLSYQLYPRAKIATAIAATLWCLLSYPTAWMLLHKAYDGEYQQELGYDISFWVVFFHIVSVMHCFDEVAHIAVQNSKDVQQQQLVEEFAAVKKAQTMSAIAVIEETRECDDEQLEVLYGADGVEQFKALPALGLFAVKAAELDASAVEQNIALFDSLGRG